MRQNKKVKYSLTTRHITQSAIGCKWATGYCEAKTETETE